MKINISLHHTAYCRKPTDKEVARISNELAESGGYIDLWELAYKVGEKGHTFCPVVFNGKGRTKDDFVEMQLFALDFDGEISYEKVKELTEKYNLPILFSYHTFRSEINVPRFRVVFLHGGVIRNRNIAELILEMLKKLFPDSDKRCLEVSHFYYGGKGIIEMNEDAAFRLDQLAYHYQMEVSIQCKNQYSREIKKLALKYNIGLMDKSILDICACEDGDHYICGSKCQENVEKKVSCNIIYIELPLFSTKLKITQQNWINTTENKKTHHTYMRTMNMINNVDIQKLSMKCRLFDDFVKGNPLTHDERFLLATNVIYIKGIKRTFLTIIRKFYDSIDKWDFALKYIYAMKYHPQGCDGSCPYADRCVHDVNICLTLKGRRQITKIGADQFVPVETAYAEMERCFMEAYQSNDRGLHIIKAQTGIGKTAVYIEVLNQGARLTIVAVPTVDLKHDVMRRVDRKKTVEALSLKDIRLEESCEREIKYLYDRGLYCEARQCLKEYEEALEDERGKELIRMYLELKESIRRKDKNIVMTHAELLTLSETDLQGYQIIVDEDILMTIMKSMVSVDCSEVNRAIREGLIYGNLKIELNQLMNMSDGSYMKSEYREQYYIDGSTLDKYHITGNINGLFTAGAYYIRSPDIYYFDPAELSNVKYIIMSATINSEVYRRFFYDRKIVSYDIPQAQYKGRLIQYTYMPMSRSNITELVDRLGGIRGLVEKLSAIISEKIDYCITFLSFANELGTPYHFGNIEGLDTLSGRHGLIIGTAHKDECCYKLAACYMGINVSTREAQIKRQSIEYNGWRYNFMTYEDSMLREIQLYHIETEMEQAIGRSRLLRTEGAVSLFSNFPCRQAELITDAYLTDKSEADASVNATLE